MLPFTRDITQDSYNFTGSQVHVLDTQKVGNLTTVVVYLMTRDTYDFLHWTDVVRIVYASTTSIDADFEGTLLMLQYLW